MTLASRVAPVVFLLAAAAFCGCGQSDPVRTDGRELQNARSPSVQAPRVLGDDVVDTAVAIETDSGRTLHTVTSAGTSARYRLINFEDDEYSATAPPSRTVLSPGRAGEVRMSLGEAKRMALSNNKNIEVLGFVPPAVETQIDTAESIFDPVFRINSVWQRLDEQTRSSVSSLSTTSNILTEDRFGPDTRRRPYPGQSSVGFKNSFPIRATVFQRRGRRIQSRSDFHCPSKP